MQAICGDVALIAALPQVFFEDQIPAIKKLLQSCADIGVTVEVNSWGGWHLARAAGAAMEAGPGLPGSIRWLAVSWRKRDEMRYAFA